MKYKRQHLQILTPHAFEAHSSTIPARSGSPATFLFGGKPLPATAWAKLIIKLIHSVGEAVNADPLVARRLSVVFLPNYNVKLGQRGLPRRDLSEQISLAGKKPPAPVT